MSEVLAFLVAILKNGNLIITLLSIATAIGIYKKTEDWLWAIFSFCLAYPVFCYIYYIWQEHSNRKIEESNREYFEKQQKERRERQEKIERQNEERMRDIYFSLSDTDRQNLIDLYRIPKTPGGSEYTRILNVFDTKNQMIYCSCQNISSYHFDLFEIDSNMNSIIVRINPTLSTVIADEQNRMQ